MNWITTVAMVILFAVNLVACGRSETPTPTAQPARIVNDPGSRKEEMQKREDDQEKRDKERRQQIIDEVRQAFDLAKEPERDQFGRKSPDWTKELEAASTVGAKPCRDSEKFDKMSSAFGYLRGQYVVPPPPITWEEIGANKDAVRELTAHYRVLGLRVASSFVEVFKMPRPARTKIQCGAGEGSFTLDDTDRVMRVIVNALTEVNENPTVIKQTPESLRTMLRKDFAERLAEIREDIKEGRASESDGMGHFLYIVREAIEEWKFVPEELKLTKKEVVASSDYRRR